MLEGSTVWIFCIYHYIAIYKQEALKHKSNTWVFSCLTFCTVSFLTQDFVVCFEMVIASLAHAYSFSYKPYKTMGNRLPFWQSLKMMFTVDDVAKDVSFHTKRVGMYFNNMWSSATKWGSLREYRNWEKPFIAINSIFYTFWCKNDYSAIFL